MRNINFFLQYPFILKNFISDWSINKSDLNKTFTDKALPVEFFDSPNYHRLIFTKNLLLSDYLKNHFISNDNNEYCLISNIEVTKYFPEIIKTLKIPKQLENVPDLKITAFIAKANSSSAMHFHIQNNSLLCQIKGSKEIILLSPDIFYKIKPEYFWSKYFNHSKIDFRSMNVHFPLKSFKFTLNENDALFIPAYWWHYVENQSPSIAFALFYPQKCINYVPLKNKIHAFLGKKIESIRQKII
ncbi:cupin-like domain-containing protein [Silvanigrella aquatica]|uniref:JmjC domain-containing protein n=1 Tax=Silvanigrella aquatica TaxID=1915309 RepID=A0A1L4CXT5_9BACT|nr:cupin-like domain-containing protein [Silvanigrella aquatica]APJ02758.1 hypothetical protein AXG55_01985 [Silvanigrella aquatica]